MMHSEDGSVTRGMTLQYKGIQRYSFIFFWGGGGGWGGCKSMLHLHFKKAYLNKFFDFLSLYVIIKLCCQKQTGT